jgi:tetratricopeptide (TPR) repeat protein
MDARSDYETGLAYDSTLYDLYFGIGGYHYWKSAKAGFLRWIGIFKNEKEKGIDELYIAYDSSTISKTSARSALAYIYINEEEYDSAIAIIDEIRAEYPEGHTLLWPRGEALFKARRYRESLGVYQDLYARLKSNPGNYYNLIESAHYITRCYEEMGMKEKMKTFAREVTDLCSDLPRKMRNKRRAELVYLSRVARL